MPIENILFFTENVIDSRENNIGVGGQEISFWTRDPLCYFQTFQEIDIEIFLTVHQY